MHLLHNEKGIYHKKTLAAAWLYLFKLSKRSPHLTVTINFLHPATYFGTVSYLFNLDILETGTLTFKLAKYSLSPDTTIS